MKVKTVVRVSMNDDKSRSKALKICVGILGVELAALAGAEKDQVVVVGESIDAVKLTRQLRKSMGNADIVSFGEDKKENKPAEANKVEAPPPAVAWTYAYPPLYGGYNYPMVPICEMGPGTLSARFCY